MSDERYHYAVVTDGRVTGLLTGILPTPPPGYVLAHADVRPGWLHDGQSFTEPETEPVANPQAEALDTIAALASSADGPLAELAAALLVIHGRPGQGQAPAAPSPLTT